VFSKISHQKPTINIINYLKHVIYVNTTNITYPLYYVLGVYILAWKKGIAVLTAGNTKVSPDERIRLVDGNNLEIRDIQTNDAGNYVCQIATLKPREISHTVEILGEPNFRIIYIYIYTHFIIKYNNNISYIF